MQISLSNKPISQRNPALVKATKIAAITALALGVLTVLGTSLFLAGIPVIGAFAALAAWKIAAIMGGAALPTAGVVAFVASRIFSAPKIYSKQGAFDYKKEVGAIDFQEHARTIAKDADRRVTIQITIGGEKKRTITSGDDFEQLKTNITDHLRKTGCSTPENDALIVISNLHQGVFAIQIPNYQMIDFNGSTKMVSVIPVSNQTKTIPRKVLIHLTLDDKGRCQVALERDQPALLIEEEDLGKRDYIRIHERVEIDNILAENCNGYSNYVLTRPHDQSPKNSIDGQNY